jgi:hypothetical protein
MMQGRKLARRVLGLTMGTMLTLTGCGPEGMAPEELEQAQPPVEEGATAAVQEGGEAAKQQQPEMMIPPECDPTTGIGCDDPPPGEPSWPYYTLFWKANLLSLRCITVSDWDGDDEVWLESEITGDHDSDVVWGVETMKPGWVANFDPLNPWPPYLQFSTNSLGAGGKLVALWDAQVELFDVEEQIGWTTLTGKSGTYTTILEGAGGKYELTYSVESTGCSPRSLPCPTNL